jgi:hypothetical protein
MIHSSQSASAALLSVQQLFYRIEFGHGPDGPRILSRIGGIVRFGGLSGIAPPEALGSIGLPIIPSMIFVPATFALLNFFDCRNIN